MAAEFSLSIYPWVYLSKFDGGVAGTSGTSRNRI